MASNGMYFGNSERMTWIKCADVGVDKSPQLWSLEAPLLNGGLYARRSDSAHQTYQLTWTNISQQDKQEIEDFFYRVYGDGPYFFHLPGTFGNVLPRTFASPRLAATDGTSLIKHHRPRLMPMPDTNRYPTASAYYAVESEDEREEVGVVVPPGVIAGIGWHGNSSGDTPMAYKVDYPDGGTAARAAAMRKAAGKARAVTQSGEPAGDPDVLWVDGSGVPHVWVDDGPARSNLASNTLTESLLGLEKNQGELTVHDGYIRLESAPTVVAASTPRVQQVSASNTVTVTPGERYAVQMDVRSMPGSTYSMGVRVYEKKASGVYQRVQYLDWGVRFEEWTHVSGVFEMSEETLELGWQVFYSPDTGESTPAGEWIDVRRLMIERANEVLPYRDGSMPGWFWDGTPGASSSTYDGPGWVYAGDGVQQAGDAVVDGEYMNLTPLSRTPGMTNVDVYGPANITLKIAEGSGSCTVNALAVQFRKPGDLPTSTGFINGQGHSGVELLELSDKLQSAAQDQYVVSVTMKEVGQWAQ